MPKIKYVDKSFSAKSLDLIGSINIIVAEYQRKGYSLTLRQLYYQLVSRDIVPNTEQSYERVGSILNDARLAGLVDWTIIEDRGRNLKMVTRWKNPQHIINAVSDQYWLDHWVGQKRRVECFVEKEALVDVVAIACRRYDVPYFACKGYTSQSEMWRAGERLSSYVNAGQTPVVLYLGDHDPSGIDMTRDVIERLEMFMGGAEVERLALNMDQVRKFRPPPNPAKTTDSRAGGYITKYGQSSWELDALPPDVIVSLIEEAIRSCIDDPGAWDSIVAREAGEANMLKGVAQRWGDVVDFITGGDDDDGDA